MDGEETVRRAFSGTFTKRHGHVTSRSHFRLKTKDLLYKIDQKYSKKFRQKVFLKVGRLPGPIESDPGVRKKIPTDLERGHSN
jgi:hypothetical protein